MPQRIILMMVTLFTVFSTIQLKVVTTVHAKQTFIVWLRFPMLSLTNALHKVFPSLANTVAYLTTVLSVVLRYHVHSTPAVKPDSSYFLEHTQH